MAADCVRIIEFHWHRGTVAEGQELYAGPWPWDMPSKDHFIRIGGQYFFVREVIFDPNTPDVVIHVGEMRDR